MVASSCAAPRISGEYESVTTELFIASMIVFQKTRSFEFAIGGKSMTNLDRTGPAKSWLWSGGPVQTRAFDLDGRQTSYPYTGTGTVNLTYDLGNRIKNLSGTVTKAHGYDGPRPPRADSNRTGRTAYNPGALITETIYLNDTPIAAIKAAGAYLIKADHLNTPRAILGASNGARPPYPSGSWHAQISKKTNRRRYCDSLSYHHAYEFN